MFKTLSTKIFFTAIACLVLSSGLLIGFSGTHVVARMSSETRFADCSPSQPIALIVLNLTLSEVGDGDVGLTITSTDAGSRFASGSYEDVPIPDSVGPLSVSVQCVALPSFARTKDTGSSTADTAVFDTVMLNRELSNGTEFHTDAPVFRYRRGLFQSHDLDYLACAAWAMDAYRPELVEQHLAMAVALYSERTGTVPAMREARLNAMKIADRMRLGQSTELKRAAKNLGDACYGI